MSNLGQIVRLSVFSLILLSFAFSANAQEFKTVTKVAEDTLWIKWLPTNYAALTKLSAGAKISRIEVNTSQGIASMDYTNGKKWTIAPVEERFNALNRSDSIQDRLATFLEPIITPVSKEEENYVFGMLVIENVTHPGFQFQLGNVLSDTDFNKKKKYAYQIIIGDASPVYAFVNANKETQFTTPALELNLDKKKTVVCSWDLKSTQNEAFAFDVEHAVENVKNAENLLNAPYLPFKSEFEINKDLAEVRHEEPQEGAVHFYRVVGRDAFGARSLYSEWKEIYVPNLIDAYPIIDSVSVNGTERIVHSHLLSDEKSGVAIVRLLRSSEKEDGFETIRDIPLEGRPNKQFEFTADTRVLSGDAFYYKIALMNDDDTVYSQPFYFFTLDQEAPKAPQGLQVDIDSNGIARLQWMTLVDPTLLGYRVYRANAMREEFIEQTHELVNGTFWQDTLALDNLTSEVYYFIQGVDANFNQGAHSDTILALKPDTIPPVASLIRTISKKDLSIHLEITMSTSSDAFETQLFRNEAPLELVTGDYTDTNLVPGKYYEYHLVTSDRSGNTSQSKTISQMYEPGFREAPTGSIRADFQGNFVEISYELPALEIYSVQIFRAKAGDPMRRWKTITDVSEKSIRDKSISIGERYEYQVKYITKDGIHSLPLSLEVTF